MPQTPKHNNCFGPEGVTAIFEYQILMNSLVVLLLENCDSGQLTKNYAKHTNQAPCRCFMSGLIQDLVLFKTINMSIG